jgi:hypothetical protein
MFLMILNDKETFTRLAGCVIVEVPDDFDDDTIPDDAFVDGYLIEEEGTWAILKPIKLSDSTKTLLSDDEQSGQD